MMRKMLTAAAAVVGATALAVTLSGGVASAYPPGNHMRVTVVPRPVGNRSHFQATASNVKPGCTVVFHIGSMTRSSVADGSGTATVTFYANGNAGQQQLSANSIKCSSKETASTTYWLSGYVIHTDKVVKAQHPFVITAAHFRPGAKVTITVQKGNKTISFTVRADANGDAKATFRLAKGTWAITAASEGHSASSTVKVK